ncbi:hypothetical protein [Haloferax sp. ATB1]|uniref:hypothetical protein n=1 Tax=Haloferax sp. ATB1 TaxID=1508454 RepID=UPI0012FECF8B|nr:hypothetical protein [Haloferax sp. ATB1]
MDELYEFLAAVIIALVVYIVSGDFVELAAAGPFNPELLRVLAAISAPTGLKGLFELLN